jgi:hypothetical protein
MAVTFFYSIFQSVSWPNMNATSMLFMSAHGIRAKNNIKKNKLGRDFAQTIKSSKQPAYKAYLQP